MLDPTIAQVYMYVPTVGHGDRDLEQHERTTKTKKMKEILVIVGYSNVKVGQPRTTVKKYHSANVSLKAPV